MIINLTCTDEDGITTTLDVEVDLKDVDGLQDFFESIIKFCIKNGAEFPEEITEYFNG